MTLWLDALCQDVRYGGRTLRRDPGFALAVVLTLALGIGVNTAMFSVLHTVLLRPLPFPASDRLVSIRATPFGRGVYLSGPDFLDVKGQSRVFEQMAAYAREELDLTGGGEPLRLSGARVTAGFFSVLGVSPILGRSFAVDEEKTGANQVVLIGHGLWQRRFGGDPSLVGKTIRLNNLFEPANTCAVIGIMPPGFESPQWFGDKAEFWLPMPMDTEERKDRGIPGVGVVLGRLKPGIGLPQAQAEMNAIAGRLETAHPDTNKGRGFDLMFLQDQMVKDARQVLWVLMVAVAFVLVIACANVANLLLARSLVRHREMAIRGAMGAHRSRLVRQLLVESSLLSLLGGLAGTVLVLVSFKLIVALIPGDLPRIGELRIDSSAFCFTLVVALVTGVLFGLAPALRLSKPELSRVLAESSQHSIGLGGRSRLQGMLVVAEVALAMVLLVGAGLALQSLERLLNLPLGFNPENVLTIVLEIPAGRSLGEEQQIAFYDDLLNRIAALPTVASVGAVRTLPVGTSRRGVWTATIEGQPAPKPGERRWIFHEAVTLRYFQTMGIRLSKGRPFSDQDRAGTLEVAVINKTMAQQFWPGEDPFGKRFKVDGPGSWLTVVGVVDDVRREEHFPEAYRPMAQFPNLWMSLVVKTKGDPMKSAGLICGQIRAVDKDLPVQKVRTLEQIVSESVARPRFYARLLGMFAALALTLTAVGVYSVTAYGVSRRTHELGIRLALGAERSRVLRLVIRQGMTLVLIGVALGVIAALALTRFAASLLHGIQATDPVTFAVVGLLLAAVAFAACLGPARRATRIDPMTALRYE